MIKVDLSDFPTSRYKSFIFTNFVHEFSVTNYDSCNKTGHIDESQLGDYNFLKKHYANNCIIEKTMTIHKQNRYTIDHYNGIGKVNLDLL